MNIDLIILIIFAAGMIIFSIISIITRTLLKAAITLAVTSIFLTILMFYFGAWVAASFELSVCAGLITVIFISSISLIKPMTNIELVEKTKNRLKRFIYLPFILLGVLILLIIAWKNGFAPFQSIASSADDKVNIGKAIWNVRQLDMVGQIVIILTGVFGVVILFRTRGVK